MTQKLKNILCALLITAFTTGALAATESASFAASHSHNRIARKTVVAKKTRRHRRIKNGRKVVQNDNQAPKVRRHKTGKRKQAPLPLVPGSADESNA